MFGLNFSKPSIKEQLMIGGVLIVFSLLTYFIYVKYVVPLINKTDSANLEHNTKRDGIQQKNVEVLFSLLIGVLIARKPSHIGML